MIRDDGLLIYVYVVNNKIDIYIYVDVDILEIYVYIDRLWSVLI